MVRRVELLLSLGVWLLASTADAALVFAQGDYFTTNGGFNSSSPTISEYGANGFPNGSLTIPTTVGTDPRGLAFGPDGLLYTTVVRGSGAAVVALDRFGNVHQTYAMPNLYAAGSGDCGKIAVDGQHLYVSIQDSLMRFDIGNPNSGQQIYTNNQVFDQVIEPNGNLFVASAYEIDEITAEGAVLRSLPSSFPGGPAPSYTDIRGIEFDPASNKLFVTMYGYTGHFFQLMRVDATTGVLEQATTFNYGDDLFLTQSGNLLVGSDNQAPQFFTQGLSPLGALGPTSQIFVTQKTVPEASGLALFAVCCAATVLGPLRNPKLMT
jgi:hypothetical protein